MPADRDQTTAADIVFTAVSPALIMLMVGSLVFFLITVLPTGDYKERLLYTTFFFVIGAVLTARIAIQFDAARASLYGLGLAIVTFLALSAYVEYPSGTGLRSFGWLVNIGLMALIWWSANKLTWDCTHVDENRDASGRGLLSASGLAESDAAASGERAHPDSVPEQEPGKKKRKKAKGPKPSAFSSWTAAWWKHREEQKKKPHTPGVWVLYFSLAALPLFAIGQSLIPSDDDSRRRAAFLQMAVYTGSGLGLLVTTSLLGLRRYLKQRKAKMPGTLTAGWLGLGAVLIAVFLVVGAFLPRPYSEVPWFGLPQAGKSERDASDYAMLRDSAGKGDGAEGEVTEKGDGKSSAKDGDKKNAGGGKGDSSKGGGKGDSKGNDSSKGDSKGNEDAKNKSKDSSENKSDRKSEPGAGSDNDRETKEAKGNSGRGNKSGRAPETKLGTAVEKIARFLRWIVVAVVVILVIVGVALAVLKYLAPFTEWARRLLEAIANWWASLFGKKPSVKRVTAEAEAPKGPDRPPPFTEYSNPFADGSAERRDAEELVAYTFEALDAWAWDRGHGRRPDETPLEFAARLGTEFEPLERSLRRLAALFARAAYAFGELPAETKPFLEQFWEELVHGAHAGAEQVGTA